MLSSYCTSRQALYIGLDIGRSTIDMSRTMTHVRVLDDHLDLKLIIGRLILIFITLGKNAIKAIRRLSNIV